MQESTKHTPFEAMFGRVARLPVECSTDSVDANEKLEMNMNAQSPGVEERAAKRQKIEESVKLNIENSQKKQKEYITTRKTVQLLVLVWDLLLR